MLQWILITLIIIGCVTLGATLLVRDAALQVLLGVINLVVWGSAAYGALDIETIDESTGQTISHPDPTIALLAAGAAALPVVLVVAAGLKSAFD